MTARRVLRPVREELLLGAALGGLVAGALLHLVGEPGPGHVLWAATTVVGIGPATWWMWDAARRNRPGVDLLALLALVGTLVAGEYLAGAFCGNGRASILARASYVPDLTRARAEERTDRRQGSAYP